VLLMCGAITLIIFSSAVWMIESPFSPLVTDELLAITGRAGTTSYDGMQAYCFGTVPSTMWWAVTTMTTVGYGDCYPITLPGKVLSVVAMLTGIIVLALPISVIGNNFVLVNEMYEDDTRALAQRRYEADGVVLEFELRDWIRRARHEGSLRRDVDAGGASLLHKYGDGKMVLLGPFGRLQKEVLINEKEELKGPELRNRLDCLEARLDGMVRLLNTAIQSGAAPAATAPAAGGELPSPGGEGMSLSTSHHRVHSQLPSPGGEGMSLSTSPAGDAERRRVHFFPQAGGTSAGGTSDELRARPVRIPTTALASIPESTPHSVRPQRGRRRTVRAVPTATV